MIGRLTAMTVAWCAVAVAAAALDPAPPAQAGAAYLPSQSISYEFGSKLMSGYFAQKAATCSVILMVADRGDPDAVPPSSPVRLRLTLTPGQIVGLDSEEGRSLNLTCGKGATTLTVLSGDRKRLVALQNKSLQEATVQDP